MQQVDVENIIKSKNPKLLRVLPRWLINYIKKVVHQTEFNEFLVSTKDKYAHDFVKAAVENFKVKVSSSGLENIPKNEGCIIVCNHPLGGLDGIAVMHEIGKVRLDLKALVNDILMNLENVRSLLLAINKHGNNSISNLKLLEESFASNGCTIVFPAGMVSRKNDGVIYDLEWKKAFIAKAIKHKRKIIPVHVDAQNSNFFYNLALFRKKLGIKANIEMFYLVDEVYKQKGKSIHLTIGAPISYEKFTKDNTEQYWAEYVKKEVYKLQKSKVS